MQVIGSTFAAYHVPGTSFNIYDPLANIAAALNYAAHGRGFGSGPGQVGSGHGYTLGGVIPGFASGGAVGAYRQHLYAAQTAEQRAYASFWAEAQADMKAARPGSAVSGHRATIGGELDTLKARQSAEQAAFRALTGGGLTRDNLNRLVSAINAEERTAHDQGLGYLSGPWLATLRTRLTSAARIAEFPPALPKPALPAGEHVPATISRSQWFADLRKWQAHEASSYQGLEHAFRTTLRHAPFGSWAHSNATTITNELATLTKRQHEEDALYRQIAVRGAGPTAKNLRQFATRLREELKTSQDQALGHIPGGHPGWVHDLQYWLRSLANLVSRPVPKTPSHTRAPVLPPTPLIQPYADEYSFDRGGYLAPGWNLAYNGTGAPEPVGAAAAGEFHVHIHNDGVIGSRAELDNWLNSSIDRLARTGRLAYALRRSPSAP
jgi:hypothetical protein